MECLQIRKEGAEQWQYFYSNIEGFDYEPGFLYRIRVREEKLDLSQVPADASSIKYTLVSVEDKVADPKLLLNDIWVLKTLEGREIQEEDLSDGIQRPSVEFHLRDSRYLGHDGCNSLRGAIQSVGERDLQLGPGMSTRMACPDMTLPDAFLRLFSRVDSYQIKDGDLILLEGDAELLSFRKTD